jgi:hypothetical protein
MSRLASLARGLLGRIVWIVLAVGWLLLGAVGVRSLILSAPVLERLLLPGFHVVFCLVVGVSLLLRHKWA